MLYPLNLCVILNKFYFIQAVLTEPDKLSIAIYFPDMIYIFLGTFASFLIYANYSVSILFYLVVDLLLLLFSLSRSVILIIPSDTVINSIPFSAYEA